MKCVATNKITGDPCKANAMRGYEYCYVHNEEPEHVKQRAVNNVKRPPKIKAKFERITVEGIKDIPNVVLKLMNDVLQDKIYSRDKAGTLDKLINTLIKAYSEGENADMLEEIQRLLEQQQT